MALTLEWRRRIERWRNTLWTLCYRPLGTLQLTGFTTMEQLQAQEALTRRFEPMPAGTRWGAKWEYAWFKTELALPPEAAGQRIVLHIDVGGEGQFLNGEGLIWVNGQIASSCDWGHPQFTLTRSARGGERYSILGEFYAGHGGKFASAKAPGIEGGGPVPYGVPSVPEPGPTQRTIQDTTFGIWDEDVYQLCIDLETLLTLRDNLDGNSLRVDEIDAALRDMSVLVDPELPPDEMLPTVRAGRARLKPVLDCTNGSTMPRFFAIGHGHLDIAWLWPLQETERKMARTIANQLALMDEYPEHKFIQSQPHLFRMLKQRYPELYERAKKAVAAGQLVAEGGAWVEPDTNLTSGESLIRQFIHGKRFFNEEFGVESTFLWLPDVFGYSGALPQIMRGCGVRYFCTTKILWAYNGADPFPYNNFVWEGIDGSTVYAHITSDYNSETMPSRLLDKWNNRNQKIGVSTFMLPFGWGDGGGGPSRDHVEYLRRQIDLEGSPRTRIASPVEFFKEMEATPPQVRYVGELYFQAHRGTYTSQARTKKGNRQSELALREAELWSSVARALKGFQIPLPALDEAWKTVLLSHFHDILPGSSIHRVYVEAEAAYQTVLDTAHSVAQDAMSALTTSDTNALTAFNSLSWPRQALVPLPQGVRSASILGGKALPVQQIGDQSVALVSLPSTGWTTIYTANTPPAAAVSPLFVNKGLLENQHLRVELNASGEITRIFDKDAGVELAAGVCNQFRMYKDVPTWFDAWDIDSNYVLQPVELSPDATVDVVASGPLFAAIKVSRKLRQSTLTQEIRLQAGSRRIDFVTTVDWQESHKLLKVAFPVTIHANEAVHEIQFGHIRRPNHASRPYDQDRFEVSNHKWSALMEENRGIAILNDCKFGLNVLDNSINLTLLKSALNPDMEADKGVQQFTYAFYAWNGSFADSALIHEGYELNCPVQTAANGAGEKSLFSVDAPNVILETIKPAEDGSADIVVRLYEAKRTMTRCTLTTTLPVSKAVLTDMLENPQQEIPVSQGNITLDFRPFEVKTLRLTTAR